MQNTPRFEAVKRLRGAPQGFLKLVYTGHKIRPSQVPDVEKWCSRVGAGVCIRDERLEVDLDTLPESPEGWTEAWPVALERLDMGPEPYGADVKSKKVRAIADLARCQAEVLELHTVFGVSDTCKDWRDLRKSQWFRLLDGEQYQPKD